MSTATTTTPVVVVPPAVATAKRSMTELQNNLATAMGPFLVTLAVLGIFLAAMLVAWWTHDSSLQVLLGMAGTNASLAVGYWLGSSSGSKSKDATIADMGIAASTGPTVAPVVAPVVVKTP